MEEFGQPRVNWNHERAVMAGVSSNLAILTKFSTELRRVVEQARRVVSGLTAMLQGSSAERSTDLNGTH